ncbi:MAG: HlyD family secretion protein [Planctomycetota bacterium]|jgi:multidrug resistance efflux pump
MKRIRGTSWGSGRLHLHILPILVWLGAVACVVILFRHRSERFEVLGIAQGRMHQVCAPVDSRLKIVSVELFEDVSKGQMLAALDDSQLNAQIATIHAEIEHLTSQLVSIQDTMLAEAANLQTESVASQRRFNVDVENIRLRILELKASIETDKVTAEDLAVEVKIATELLKKEAIAPYELQKAEALYKVVAKRIEENQHLLTQAEKDLKQAQQRRDEFAQRQLVHPSVNSAIETIRKQIVVQEKLIAELSVQRESLRITSPIDGKVVQIQIRANQAALRRPGEDVLRKPGEVVLAGDPILVVAETQASEIVAYINQEQLAKVKETMVVQLVKGNEPAQIASSQVARLGPTMELMPQQLWQNTNIAQWGQPILIKVPPGLKLLPGETVGIKGL